MTDLNVNPETGEVTQGGRSPRFTLWIAFLVFATVTLGASVEVKNDQDDPNSAAKWAVACSAITFTVTVVVVLIHLFSVVAVSFVGTIFEGALALILCGFWAATVSIVTNASNGLSVNSDATNQVVNGNLYYFSWAGFVTSIVILVGYLRSAFGVDVVGEFRNRGARLTLWAGFLASSLVVMGSAARVHNQDCTPNLMFPDRYCSRTNFAIALGTLGVFLSIIVVGLKMCYSTTPFLIEFVTAVLLTILDAVGVALITSSSGPGSAIGNLYYFSWISFLCAAFLAADCFNQFVSGDAGPGGANASTNGVHQNGTKTDDGDIQIESLEDQI